MFISTTWFIIAQHWYDHEIHAPTAAIGCTDKNVWFDKTSCLFTCREGVSESVSLLGLLIFIVCLSYTVILQILGHFCIVIMIPVSKTGGGWGRGDYEQQSTLYSVQLKITANLY